MINCPMKMCCLLYDVGDLLIKRKGEPVGRCAPVFILPSKQGYKMGQTAVVEPLLLTLIHENMVISMLALCEPDSGENWHQSFRRIGSELLWPKSISFSIC